MKYVLIKIFFFILDVTTGNTTLQFCFPRFNSFFRFVVFANSFRRFIYLNLLSIMKVSEGFQVADSRNLPKVDYLMLLEYMQENDCFNVAETRSAKTLLASREAYVDTAVGYVEVRRDGDLCIINCRVTPEHKIKAKLYRVTATINETEQKFVKMECNDCAASAGGCKHAICFAMWLIKRTDEPSVTSTMCYWKKPKLAGAVHDQKFILAKNLGKRKISPENVNVDMDVTLTMFAEECKKRNSTSGMVLKYSGYREPTLKNYSMFNLMLKFLHETNDDFSYDNFKVFCENILTIDAVNNIAKATKHQATSKLWHTMRQGRVTGSRIYEAVHCKTENGALVQSILGGYKVPETTAIKRGKMLEKVVLEKLEQELDVKMGNTGIILISPIIGVSPDAVTEEYVVEIKCPVSVKTMKNYVKNDKLHDKFKAQIMMQMHATKKTKGLFCVADPSFEQTKTLHKYWVDYDKSYAEELLNAAEVFWKTFIFNIILDSAK